MKYLYLVFILLIICSCTRKNFQYGAVSSASPEATEIGMRIFERGGNAADAAIAVQFALGVTVKAERSSPHPRL